MLWKGRPSDPGGVAQGRFGGQNGKMSIRRLLAFVLLSAASPAALALTPALPAPEVAPSEIVAAAPAEAWTTIAADQLLVMDLAPDAAGHARRVVIQLVPAPWSQGWVGNIRKLAQVHWWDATAITRVQDGYVVQWGDPDAENKARAKALPSDLLTTSQGGYVLTSGAAPPLSGPELADAPYSAKVRFHAGWPIAMEAGDAPATWPVHCYGTVGVGRDMPPDAGTGAELYAVIGQAPRQLDRNIAVVGRVIDGMEWLSSLPRGHGEIGFYQTPAERTPIRSIRLGSEVPDLATWQYLSTDSPSFARYVAARANRRDAFYVRPAGGVDVCNAPVPIRRAPAKR